MEAMPQPFSGVRVERVIGAVRVALGASSLLAIWLDPEQQRNAELTYILQLVYLGYALTLFAVMWNRDSVGRLPVIAHVTDISMAAMFQYVTLGPASPFFTFFVFSLFSAALRWGWHATIRTAGVVLSMYLLIGIFLSQSLNPAEFKLNRFVSRSIYLLVVTVVLVYLGRHESRLREEIRRLARWPLASAGDWAVVIPKILDHAAGIIGAVRVTLIWSSEDEPWVYVATWPIDPAAITKHAPDEFEPMVPAPLEDCTFVSSDRLTAEAQWSVSRAGTQFQWRGLPIHPGLAARADGTGVLSAPFRTDYL